MLGNHAEIKSKQREKSNRFLGTGPIAHFIGKLTSRCESHKSVGLIIVNL